MADGSTPAAATGALAPAQPPVRTMTDTEVEIRAQGIAQTGLQTLSPVADPESVDGELFDLAALAQTFGGKPDKMRKYAMLFVESARDGMREIDAALARDDLLLLSELGHRIKSSARAVGAMRFGNLCLALERVRSDPDTANARRLVAQMHAMLVVLDRHIAQELMAYAPG
ncbi:MAG TPA: Hpt domain-containing protein, partial [Duganella sp.]|nr:Hpt domain-containing protein [Duganella sp.]